MAEEQAQLELELGARTDGALGEDCFDHERGGGRRQADERAQVARSKQSASS